MPEKIHIFKKYDPLLMKKDGYRSGTGPSHCVPAEFYIVLIIEITNPDSAPGQCANWFITSRGPTAQQIWPVGLMKSEYTGFQVKGQRPHTCRPEWRQVDVLQREANTKWVSATGCYSRSRAVSTSLLTAGSPHGSIAKATLLSVSVLDQRLHLYDIRNLRPGIRL